jgi:hypothetical protein
MQGLNQFLNAIPEKRDLSPPEIDDVCRQFDDARAFGDDDQSRQAASSA